jgi:hypothetical protein
MVSEFVLLNRCYYGYQVWEGAVHGTHSLCGNSEKCYEIISGKPERTRSLGIPIYRWDYDIKFILRKLVHGSVNRVCLVEDKFQWRDFMKT